MSQWSRTSELATEFVEPIYEFLDDFWDVHAHIIITFVCAYLLLVQIILWGIFTAESDHNGPGRLKPPLPTLLNIFIIPVFDYALTPVFHYSSTALRCFRNLSVWAADWCVDPFTRPRRMAWMTADKDIYAKYNYLDSLHNDAIAKSLQDQKTISSLRNLVQQLEDSERESQDQLAAQEADLETKTDEIEDLNAAIAKMRASEGQEINILAFRHREEMQNLKAIITDRDNELCRNRTEDMNELARAAAEAQLQSKRTSDHLRDANVQLDLIYQDRNRLRNDNTTMAAELKTVQETRDRLGRYVEKLTASHVESMRVIKSFHSREWRYPPQSQSLVLTGSPPPVWLPALPARPPPHTAPPPPLPTPLPPLELPTPPAANEQVLKSPSTEVLTIIDVSPGVNELAKDTLDTQEPGDRSSYHRADNATLVTDVNIVREAWLRTFAHEYQILPTDSPGPESGFEALAASAQRQFPGATVHVDHLKSLFAHHFPGAEGSRLTDNQLARLVLELDQERKFPVQLGMLHRQMHQQSFQDMLSIKRAEDYPDVYYHTIWVYRDYQEEEGVSYSHWAGLEPLKAPPVHESPPPLVPVPNSFQGTDLASTPALNWPSVPTPDPVPAPAPATTSEGYTQELLADKENIANLDSIGAGHQTQVLLKLRRPVDWIPKPPPPRKWHVDDEDDATQITADMFFSRYSDTLWLWHRTFSSRDTRRKTLPSLDECRIIHTPSDGLRCGYHALILSAQEQFPDIPSIDVDMLQRLFVSYFPEQQAVNLTDDQLAHLLFLWGQNMVPPQFLELGTYRAEHYAETHVPEDCSGDWKVLLVHRAICHPTENYRTIWIHHDNGEANGATYSHWSGLGRHQSLDLPSASLQTLQHEVLDTSAPPATIEALSQPEHTLSSQNSATTLGPMYGQDLRASTQSISLIPQGIIPENTTTAPVGHDSIHTAPIQITRPSTPLTSPKQPQEQSPNPAWSPLKPYDPNYPPYQEPMSTDTTPEPIDSLMPDTAPKSRSPTPDAMDTTPILTTDTSLNGPVIIPSQSLNTTNNDPPSRIMELYASIGRGGAVLSAENLTWLGSPHQATLETGLGEVDMGESPTKSPGRASSHALPLIPSSRTVSNASSPDPSSHAPVSSSTHPRDAVPLHKPIHPPGLRNDSDNGSTVSSANSEELGGPPMSYDAIAMQSGEVVSQTAESHPSEGTLQNTHTWVVETSPEPTGGIFQSPHGRPGTFIPQDRYDAPPEVLTGEEEEIVDSIESDVLIKQEIYSEDERRHMQSNQNNDTKPEYDDDVAWSGSSKDGSPEGASSSSNTGDANIQGIGQNTDALMNASDINPSAIEMAASPSPALAGDINPHYPQPPAQTQTRTQIPQKYPNESPIWTGEVFKQPVHLNQPSTTTSSSYKYSPTDPKTTPFGGTKQRGNLHINLSELLPDQAEKPHTSVSDSGAGTGSGRDNDNLDSQRAESPTSQASLLSEENARERYDHMRTLEVKLAALYVCLGATRAKLREKGDSASERTRFEEAVAEGKVNATQAVLTSCQKHRADLGDDTRGLDYTDPYLPDSINDLQEEIEAEAGERWTEWVNDKSVQVRRDSQELIAQYSPSTIITGTGGNVTSADATARDRALARARALARDRAEEEAEAAADARGSEGDFVTHPYIQNESSEGEYDLDSHTEQEADPKENQRRNDDGSLQGPTDAATLHDDHPSADRRSPHADGSNDSSMGEADEAVGVDDEASAATQSQLIQNPPDQSQGTKRRRRSESDEESVARASPRVYANQLSRRHTIHPNTPQPNTYQRSAPPPPPKIQTIGPATIYTVSPTQPSPQIPNPSDSPLDAARYRLFMQRRAHSNYTYLTAYMERARQDWISNDRDPGLLAPITAAEELWEEEHDEEVKMMMERARLRDTAAYVDLTLKEEPVVVVSEMKRRIRDRIKKNASKKGV